MAQKKHKKRKQHTKAKPAVEQAAAQAAQPDAEKGAAASAKKSEDKAAAKAAKKAAKAKAKAAEKKQKKPGIFSRFIDYCKAVKSELQRVVWPTRQELVNASLIVVGAIIFFGVFIAIFDNIVVFPLDWISSLGA